MQSARKHKRDKVERVNAKEYADAYVKNFYTTGGAALEAEKHAKNAPDQNTANFWRNVLGHINKIGA